VNGTLGAGSAGGERKVGAPRRSKGGLAERGGGDMMEAAKIGRGNEGLKDCHFTTGSHVVLWRARDGARVVVPGRNRDSGRGLTLRIMKSAGLTREESERRL
jgi:predicted RNA binding protein YcfA (HicA-like mRNA interferase family)